MTYKYDLAISFAGEQRDLAQQFARRHGELRRYQCSCLSRSEPTISSVAMKPTSLPRYERRRARASR
jgi:hypothetical protein